MIPLADLTRAENISAGMVRGLNVPPLAWTTLLAIAQRAMSAFQQSDSVSRATELYEEANAAPLIAIARMLEGIAERGVEIEEYQKYEEDDSEEDTVSRRRRLIRLLASCAYAMAGNFPSAAAAQASIDIGDIESDCELVSLAVCNPRLIGSVLRVR